MREKLQEIDGERRKFIAKIERFGSKKGYRGEAEQTVLLRGVTLQDGSPVTDHVWFAFTKSWRDALEAAGILFDPKSIGASVIFDARSAPYEKGYQGRRAVDLGEDSRKTDWKLSNPTNISVLSNT